MKPRGENSTVAGTLDSNRTTELLSSAANPSRAHLLLAHGAGAPMTSPFMEQLSKALTEYGISVHRFEYLYMAERRTGGKRRPPPPVAQLAREYRHHALTLAGITGGHILIGGKSMGGRVASMIADELHDSGPAAGCICFGYPFHPPGKPGSLRVEHLAALRCPTLIVQGERDPLGTRHEVETYTLSGQISIEWLAAGDHDLKPSRASGHTQAGHISLAAAAAGRFAASLAEG